MAYWLPGIIYVTTRLKIGYYQEILDVYPFLWYGARFTHSSSNGLRLAIDISSVLMVVVMVSVLGMVIKSP